MKHAPNILDIRRLPEGLVSVLPALGCQWGAEVLLDAAEYKELWIPLNTTYLRIPLGAVPPENLQHHRKTPEGARDYGPLKKKSANFSNWEISCTSSEKLNSPKKFSEVFRISRQTDY